MSSNTNVEPMQLSTPERRPSTAIASLLGEEGHFGCHIPTPTRNNIARVTDQTDNPYFSREEILDGVASFIYKPIGPFKTDVPVAEVKKLISVSEVGPAWKGGDTKEGPHERANFFRKYVLPLIPVHVALAFHQPMLFQFSSKKKTSGRRRQYEAILVGMKGHCSAKIHGCPTTFGCGFTEKSINTLLNDPSAESIELSVFVHNGCIHAKGLAYGQLRGTARAKVIVEFESAGKKPAEFAKRSLQLASDDEYHSKNRGAAVTKLSAPNISREAKKKQQATSGFTTCKLANIPLAASITEKNDIEQRKRIGDETQDFLGIVRMVQLWPSFRIILYTKPNLQLFQYFSHGGQLVLHCDATGGLLNFPMVEEWKDKVLHTKLAVNPKYVCLSGEYTRDKQVSRLLSAITMAEMVSNKNTAADYGDFFSGFLSSVRQLFKNERTEQPLIIMTDCSIMLESGALLAFSSGDGMVHTRIEYSNAVLLHLLHYDKLVSAITCDTLGVDELRKKKEAASIILASLRMTVGIFLKECRSHVFRAPKHWMRSHQRSEFATMKPLFEGLLSKVFEEVTKEPKISVVIAQLSLVVAMLETEKFECPSFYDTTEVKECRGELEEGAEERMLKAVDSFIRGESESLHIQSMEDLRARLDHGDMKRKHILLHDSIVERAKEVMKGQCCAYLHSFPVSNDDANQKVATVDAVLHTAGAWRMVMRSNHGEKVVSV